MPMPVLRPRRPVAALFLLLPCTLPLRGEITLAGSPLPAAKGAKAAYRLDLAGAPGPDLPIWRATITQADTAVPVLAADLDRWLSRDPEGRWVLAVPSNLHGRLSLQAVLGQAVSNALDLDLPEGPRAASAFAALPDALKGHILTWAGRDGAGLDRASSKALKAAARTVTVDGTMTAGALRDYLAARPGLRELRLRDLRHLSADDLAGALGNLHSLHTLRVATLCRPFETRHLTQLALANPGLSVLQVPHTALTAQALSARSDTLTHLSILRVGLRTGAGWPERQRLHEACAALRGCARLQELEAWSGPHLRDDHLEDGDLPPGLRRLRVRGVSSLAGRSLPAALEELTLHHCHGLVGPAPGSALALPRLRRLDIADCPKLSQASLAALIQASPALAELSTDRPIPEAAMDAMRSGFLTHLTLPQQAHLDLGGLPRLTHLTLLGDRIVRPPLDEVRPPRLALPPSLLSLRMACPPSPGSDLPAGLQHLALDPVGPSFPEGALPPWLKVLEAHAASQWDGTGLPSGLRSLKLAHCPNLRHLDHLKALEHLHLMDCPGLLQGGAPQIVALAPSLRHLQVEDEGDPGMDLGEVLALAGRLPGLHSLSLRRGPCSGFNRDLVIKALQAHPGLRTVSIRCGWPDPWQAALDWRRDGGEATADRSSSSSSTTTLF